MSRARDLSKLSSPSAFTVDTDNNIGVNSTSPTEKLNVVGVVSATSFIGDGSGLTGLANTTFVNSEQINVSGFVTATTFSGNLSGTAVTATTFSGNLSGTAVTATTFSGNLSGTAVTATTFTGALTGNATGLSGTPDVSVKGVNSTGIVTAVMFSGNITGTAATFSGDMSVGGTLNYEDVTNIDSIGIITARSNVSIADSIIHTGDTDTSIRFPSAGTFTVNTDGSERLRIASDGDIRVGSAFSVGQAGVVTCSTVEARVPQIPQNVQASTYTLVKADAGKHINAGGNVTVNSGIFAIGDCISIFNDTTGDITIIQGTSVTLRLVADTSTGSRTLANYGLAAVLCVGSNEFVVSGGGIS